MNTNSKKNNIPAPLNILRNIISYLEHRRKKQLILVGFNDFERLRKHFEKLCKIASTVRHKSLRNRCPKTKRKKFGKWSDNYFKAGSEIDSKSEKG